MFDPNLELKQQKWNLERNVPNAIDLLATLSANNLMDSEESINVISFLRENLPNDIPLAHIIKNHIDCRIPNFGIMPPEKNIALLKRLIRSNLLSPLEWLELARMYTIIGQAGTANCEKAIKAAMQLAPNNRYVLRSASRYCIHIGEIDRAIHILMGSNRSRVDPWLASSLLAAQQIKGVPPKAFKNLKYLSENTNWSIYSRSELLAGIGTLISWGGAYKKAKKFFRSALEDPTENAFAQAQWFEEYKHETIMNKKLINKNPLTNLSAHEANMGFCFQKKEWAGVIDNAVKWQEDESFSSRPVIQGSFVALSIIRNYTSARSLLDAGIKANPKNTIINNNLALCKALQDDIGGAAETLSKVITAGLQKEDLAIIKATDGLIKFRAGDYEKGRVLYKEAIDTFRSSKDQHALTICLHYFAREEFKSNHHDRVKIILAEAQDIVDKKNDTLLNGLSASFKEEMEEKKGVLQKLIEGRLSFILR